MRVCACVYVCVCLAMVEGVRVLGGSGRLEGRKLGCHQHSPSLCISLSLLSVSVSLSLSHSFSISLSHTHHHTHHTRTAHTNLDMEKLKRLSDPEGAPQMKKLSLFIVFYFLLRRPLHLLQLHLHTCIRGRVQIDLCRLSKRCMRCDGCRKGHTNTNT